MGDFVEYISAKQIILKNKYKGWFGTDYTMNIYRGCCHGCIYCDSRSQCYGIEDFSKIYVKENALEIIENELRHKKFTGIIGMGSMSDPYNPREERLRLTRGALELIHTYGYGVTLITKSDLVKRDTDILKAIADKMPVLVKITITTTDDKLAKIIEPNAPLPSERLEAIRTLSELSIYTGVLLTPVLPFITDNEKNIISVIENSAKAGGKFVYTYNPMGVTMRDRQRDYLYKQLDKSFSGLKEKYMYLYGNKYNCRVPDSNKLMDLFKQCCQSNGLLYEMSDIEKAYKQDCDNRQIRLF